ncbi:MAG: prepilin-type N-terminal cleavage/methylation domain-containing protein, partial [Pseudomonadota bacterium]|nr:prepilin-type N-terminal cleavage/methylation domain-containing protein [Pseudomonadota bacterium]
MQHRHQVYDIHRHEGVDKPLNASLNEGCRATRDTTFVKSRSAKLQHGLTLLEMLVAVAVLAIVVTSVAPNIQSLLIKN